MRLSLFFSHGPVIRVEAKAPDYDWTWSCGRRAVGWLFRVGLFRRSVQNGWVSNPTDGPKGPLGLLAAPARPCRSTIWTCGCPAAAFLGREQRTDRK